MPVSTFKLEYIAIVNDKIDSSPNLSQIENQASFYFIDSLAFVTASKIFKRRLQLEVFKKASRPFNLEQEQGIRAYLIFNAENKKQHYLLLVVHHIIADGTSFNVFSKELSHLYNAYTKNLIPTLSPLTIQYKDYSRWQRAISPTVITEQLQFWKKQLHKAPSFLQLPTDKPRPATNSFQGGNVYLTIPVATSKALKILAEKNNATLYMVLLGIFQVLLCRYTQQTDMLIGSPVANRHKTEFKNLMGFFVNTVVIRAQISEQPLTFVDCLAQVRQTVLDALANQTVPFEQVVQALNSTHNLNENPLVQVMFVLQNYSRQTIDLHNLDVTLEMDSPMAKFDLTLECIEKKGAIDCHFEYATDLFERNTILQMANNFLALAKNIALLPTSDIHTISFLSPQEVALQKSWQGLKSFYPKKTGHSTAI